MLQTLTNKSVPDASPSTTSEDQATDTDRITLQVTALIGEKESEGSDGFERSEDGISTGNEELESQKDPEKNVIGTSFLQAIKDGDNDAFESLLPDADLSFKDKDGRNPLLLAAHLGNVSMVQRLLTDEGCTHLNVSRNDPTEVHPPASFNNGEHEMHTKTTYHHGLNLDATDKLGRTALHYCAEFEMCDAANILLDHGVDVNTRDEGDYPPAYFAAKNRKYFAMELLLARGASNDFTRPTTTSDEIEKLLDRPRNNDHSSSISTFEP